MSPLNAVFAVHKPLGLTSNFVTKIIRRRLMDALNDQAWIKVGHGGTLDLPADGVLVIGIGGTGCSSLQSYLSCDKRYRVTMQLGSATDSYDSTGTVTRTGSHSDVTPDMIERALPSFIGAIQQRPPIYSALSINGERLYKLARAGKIDESAVKLRTVLVHSCNLVDFDRANGEATLTMHTGSGTYIRSLVHDIGQMLGCYAHVKTLTRTKQAQFALRPDDADDACDVALDLDAVTLAEVQSRCWSREEVAQTRQELYHLSVKNRQSATATNTAAATVAHIAT